MVFNRILQLIFVVLLLGIPLLFLLILEGKKKTRATKEIYQAFKKLGVHFLFLFLFSVWLCRLFKVSLRIRTWIGAFLTGFILLVFLFIGNYFGTKKKIIRENTLLFLKKTNQFFLENTPFYFFIVVCFLFLEKFHVSIAYSFLGAAFFFLLSRFYKEEKGEIKKLKGIDFWNQVLLNVGLISYLSYVLSFMISLIQKGAILGVGLLELLGTIFFILIILFVTYHFDFLLKKVKSTLKKKF